MDKQDTEVQHRSAGTDAESTSPQADVKDVNLSRRRFATASAPVLLTLANRPAMANMCSVSGRMSGNMSGANMVKCVGDSPSEWVSSGAVPNDYQTIKFSDQYTGHSIPLQDPDLTLAAALDLGDQSILANIVAAELNIATYGESAYGINAITLRQWVIPNDPCLPDLLILNGVV